MNKKRDTNGKTTNEKTDQAGLMLFFQAIQI